MFIDVSDLTPGSAPWIMGQLADLALLLGLPLMVGGMVGAFAMWWGQRRG